MHWEKLRDLPFEVGDVTMEFESVHVFPEFERRTTTVHLRPDLRFKLDPTPEWTDDFIDQLAARKIVDVTDLKGQYSGTPVDNPADPELYRRVAEAFPEAWIEDPALTPESDAVLEPHRD